MTQETKLKNEPNQAVINDAAEIRTWLKSNNYTLYGNGSTLIRFVPEEFKSLPKSILAMKSGTTTILYEVRVDNARVRLVLFKPDESSHNEEIINLISNNPIVFSSFTGKKVKKSAGLISEPLVEGNSMKDALEKFLKDHNKIVIKALNPLFIK